MTIGGQREMDDALLGTEPSQLRIGGETPPEAGEVRGDVVEPLADDEMAERVDRRGADFVAAPDRERQPVALEAGVGPQDDVRRRVVGIDVHRVRAGVRARRRKAEVEDLEVADRSRLHGRTPARCRHLHLPYLPHPHPRQSHRASDRARRRTR